MSRSPFRKILQFILFILIILSFIWIYRAYVIIKPCRHTIDKLEPADSIKLDDFTLTRFQNALKIKTISFDEEKQNTTAIDLFGKFIRQGDKLI